MKLSEDDWVIAAVRKRFEAEATKREWWGVACANPLLRHGNGYTNVLISIAWASWLTSLNSKSNTLAWALTKKDGSVRSLSWSALSQESKDIAKIEGESWVPLFTDSHYIRSHHE